MTESDGLTDSEVVAELTDECPLWRYCVVAGTLRTWVKLRRPDSTDGDWLPLSLIVEDNRLARVAVDAMLRAGVPSFRSSQEAVVWVRTQSWFND
jgi:hypothetical protein